MRIGNFSYVDQRGDSALASTAYLSSALLSDASLSTAMAMHPYPTSSRDSKPNSMLDRLTEAVDKSFQHCENNQPTKHTGMTRVKYVLEDLAAKFNHDDDDASVRVATCSTESQFEHS
jgi:hypothetical protein